MNNLTKGLLFTLTSILFSPLMTNEVKAEEFCIQSIANPCKPEVSEMPEQAKRRAERILDSDNCALYTYCLLYTSPSPRDAQLSRMPSSA